MHAVGPCPGVGGEKDHIVARARGSSRRADNESRLQPRAGVGSAPTLGRETGGAKDPAPWCVPGGLSPGHGPRRGDPHATHPGSRPRRGNPHTESSYGKAVVK